MIALDQTASPLTPAGKAQARVVHYPDYVAPDVVRTFDTFEACHGHTKPGVLRVYAGNGTSADPSGAAFDFLNGRLIGFGARVDVETMARIVATAEAAA